MGIAELSKEEEDAFYVEETPNGKLLPSIQLIVLRKLKKPTVVKA